MSEDKVLEMIKKSADSVEVPEELKPDVIEGKLNTQNGSSGFHWNRWGKVVAAAAVCIVVGVAGMKMIPDQMESATEEAATEEIAVNESVPAEEAALGEPVFVSSVDEVYVEADSYEAVYKAMYGDYEADGAMAGDMARAYGVAEIAEEAAEEEAAVEESGTTAATTDAAPMEIAEEAAVEESVAEDSTVGASGSTSYSTTNVQEFGVDEADIVKTDGNYIYVVDADKGLRIVEVNQGEMSLISMTPLEDTEETILEMYVDGDTLNLVTYGYETSLAGAEEESTGEEEIADEEEDIAVYDSYSVNTEEVIHLYTYDISDRSRVKLTGEVSQAGMYESSRKVGDIIYLFSQYWPRYCEGKDDTEGYIPKVNGDVMEADDIMIPAVSRYDQTSLVISSVNVTEPNEIIDCKSILAGSNLFYVSTSNIYITLTEWGYDYEVTNLVRFSYDDKGKITAEAAGTVKGYLNDSFSLNEYEDHLRVVTTCYNYNLGGEENYLYVLDENMEVTGKIEDLAYQETVRSARFMGDIGYFVTFRQTDPLFSVDLSDPSNPKILGELKVTGFSSYLHFYGEDKLLGIGWEADEDTGEIYGLKLSMFDISDPSNVTELDRIMIEDVYDCEALNNYKSILVDPEKNILGLAYIQGESGSDTYQVKGYYYQVYSYDEEDGFVNEYTYVDEESASTGNYYELLQVTRGIYIGDWFYLCNSSNITSFDMANGYEKGSEIIWE